VTRQGRAQASPYRLVVAGPADRRISEQLPESVAGAVAQLITGDLLTNPHKVGKPLGGPLTGIWSARRGVYRVLYEIDEEAHTVTVLDVGHRSGVYRGRPRRPR
jgi:mRNA interferase RelE/StbE